MSIHKIILLFISINFLFLVGCKQLFQPVPDMFRQWEKNEVSINETKEFMLYCGYSNPYAVGSEVSNNDYALMHLCMEQHGFKYTGNLGRYCDRHPTVPACIEAAAAKKVR